MKSLQGNSPKQSSKETVVVKIYVLLVVLFPILYQYVSPVKGIVLGEFVLLLAGAFLICAHPQHVKIEECKGLLLFFGIGACTSFISFSCQMYYIDIEVVTRIVRYTFYLFVVVLSYNHVSVKSFIKTYNTVCVLIAVYIIIQFICYKGFHMYLPTKVLPINWTRSYDINALIKEAEQYSFRADGVFQEAGYAVRYLLPFISLIFYDYSKPESVRISKKRALAFLIVSIAIVFCNSTQGMVIYFISVAVLGLAILKEKSAKTPKYILLGLTIVFLIVLSLGGYFTTALRRLGEITGNVRAGSSVALRIFRGPAVYLRLPLIYQFIGVGHGNVGSFVESNRIATPYDASARTIEALGFVNGFSEVLISYGIIGIICLLILLYSLYKKANSCTKIVIIQFVVLQFIGEGVLSHLVVFYFALIFCMNSADKERQRVYREKGNSW